MQFPTQLFRAGGIIVATLAVVSALYAIQRPFRKYVSVEGYDNYPMPPDFQDPGEWTFGRLMYPPVGRIYGGFEIAGAWTEGGSNWAMDYPRSDRHLSQAVRRLSRIQARSVEIVVNLDDGDQYDWPFLYGVEVGHWNLTDAQARSLREFLMRGGFFMCDDFHGQIEWDVFWESMHRVFPDRPVLDIPNGDPIFHTVYDLDERYQVPGALVLETHRTYEKGETGKVPHWRGIYDDHGRVMVAICHNMDLGDSWEHADNPLYAEKWSSLGFRIAINYITYSMTH